MEMKFMVLNEIKAVFELVVNDENLAFSIESHDLIASKLVTVAKNYEADHPDEVSKSHSTIMGLRLHSEAKSLLDSLSTVDENKPTFGQVELTMTGSSSDHYWAVRIYIDRELRIENYKLVLYKITYKD